ncbi:MAG: FAD-binding domain-containing protein [Sphingomonadaceae bacterium]
MSAAALFPPTRAAALQRIAAVDPVAYARSRNALGGAVSQLSPYLTHGIVSLPEVLAGVAAQHPIDAQHKFVYELGWRAYFHHVWAQRGDAILHSLHPGPLPDAAYLQQLPDDIRHARTGIAVIDQAVRTLYATGYLHNHARMWLASYVVHLRHVHWRTGADWMIGHLLDGDLASNHLSWQWVAGTGSHKPYLFNADNVARFAPASWHSSGSAIDTSYEALEAVARGGHLQQRAAQHEGVPDPVRGGTPPPSAGHAPQPAEVAGRDVWLVHPWALGEVPDDLPDGCLLLGWWSSELHAAWPWSAARWAFVSTRMAALAPLAWYGSQPQLAAALAGARSVQTWADPHVSPLLPPQVQQRTPAQLFRVVDVLCPSFSTWWRRSTQGVAQLTDLPGLAALGRPHRA